MKLAGLLTIRDDSRRRWRAARRELKRVGPLGLLDVVAFRAYARLVHGTSDARWEANAIAGLRRRYPATLDDVPRLTVSSPNSTEARAFLKRLQPDLAVARCKVLLRQDVFEIPRAGTFVLHPGICPEYRNAHGCFWALANRDLNRVGMTLLRVDTGIDTGPIYLHGRCEFDDVRDSHIVVQQRAVLENLESVGNTLQAIARGDDVPRASTDGRRSAVWGQPRLTDYFRWKLAARRSAPLKGCPTSDTGRPGVANAGRPVTGGHEEAHR
jgi:hypothetical protein